MEDYIFGGVIGTATALVALAIIKKVKKRKVLKKSLTEIKLIDIS